MEQAHITHLTVRGYELDSFGHVNHAVYLNYLEHARWEFLRAHSVGLEEFKTWNRWPVIGELQIRYQKPTFMHDALRVETRVIERGRALFVFEQKILRAAQSTDGKTEDQVVVTAQVRVVMVNERGRPDSIPEAMLRIAPGLSPT